MLSKILLRWSGSDIAINILKQSRLIYKKLKDCINYTVEIGHSQIL